MKIRKMKQVRRKMKKMNKEKTKVKTEQFEYEEDVKEFTGLIFHCPNCDEHFHLHIATVKLLKKGKEND